MLNDEIKRELQSLGIYAGSAVSDEVENAAKTILTAQNLLATAGQLAYEITPEKLMTAVSLAAVLSIEKGNYVKAGEAFYLIVFMQLQSGNTANAKQTAELIFNSPNMPEELLTGVLNGLAVFDAETGVKLGKQVLDSTLAGRNLKTLMDSAHTRSNIIKFYSSAIRIGWVLLAIIIPAIIIAYIFKL